MKLFVLHVSDIHLSTIRYPNNYILGRAPQILAAVQSLFLKEENVASCLLLVAGDIAYAGLKDEYAIATPFFRELQDGLATCFPNASRHTAFLPGNHDCDFKADDQARKKLIEDPDMEALADGSIVTTATEIQDNFFGFARAYSGSSTPATGLDRLFSQLEFDVVGKRVVVRLLNSAWASRLPEGRSLMLPVKYLHGRFTEGPVPDVAITAVHHPYNWFEPNNAIALRRLFEETTDIVVTGHEHSAGSFTKTGRVGEQNEYIEGGVLQENGDPSSSSFNVILIDVTEGSQELHHFEWSGNLYERVNEVVARPFIRNKNRLKTEFALDGEFEETLDDADMAYSHPRKERVKLVDIFLFPDLRELDERHSKTTTKIVRGPDFVTHVLKKGLVLITSAEKAGKTAISRSLFKALRQGGKIPLLLSGRDVKASNSKQFQRHLDNAFDAEYSDRLRTHYWQLPKESRAVVVDDYHRLPATRVVRDRVVGDLMQRFGIVVLLGGYESAFRS